jgi:hypothetical protein
MPDQDIVVDPSEVKPAMPGGAGGALLRYPPVAGAGDIEVDPSQVSAVYDPAKAAAAQAALERGPEVRPEGAPLYQVAPRPESTEAPPMTAGEALVTNPAKQVWSGVNAAAAAANRLTANTFHLFDTAASKIAAITGTDKGGIFKQLEDWAREQQKGQEQTAAEMAGGRQDLPSQLFRTGASAAASIPTYATATALGGPVGGMAALGALETADQGPKAMLEAAAQNALGGKALEVMGPASRPIRLFGAGAMTYAELRLQGVDHETALANAMTMAGMAGMHGGGKTAGEIAQDALSPGGTLRPQISIAKSTLNPTQQAAVDYLRDQGVPLTAGQQTGNKFLTAVEATTAHTPLGSQKAREFHAGTESALRDLAGELAGQAHGEPVSPYEAGTIVGDTLTHSIGELAGQANQAYEKAWEHAGDPAYTKKVQIKTATEPVLDAAGEPTGKTKKVPVYADVNMPVDVRWMKAIARDQIPKYEYLPAAERAQSAAYSILKGVLKGNDHISAQQAEEALKGLKAEVGYGTDPNMRNAAQGTAAQMVPRLQKAIDAAVGETGQDAVIGLQEGRKLHAQKMDFADVQKKLRQEPVQAFGQLTQGRDSGVNYLKEVAQRAPDSLPVLGRAYLDTLFEKAMKEGGWMRTDGVFKAWDNLGDQTKALLFPKEGQVRALDRFFLAQKITAERINTSGTALVKEAQDAGTSILKWLKGKYAGDILFSPRGIKFLTGIAQNPPRSSAEANALKAQAEKVFGPPNKPPEEPPEGQPPTGGGPPSTPPEGGGGAGPGSLQEVLQKMGDEALERVKNSGTFQGRTLPSLFPAEVTKDMATWGAARIANGAIEFGKWSKAMLDDAADISPEAVAKVRAMLPQLYKDSKKQYEHHLETVGTIADLPEIMKYYRAGKEGKNWYNFVKPALHPLFGENTDLFLKMFAATSPNTKVTQNVLNAVKAYRQFLMGEPFTGMPAHVDNLNRAVAGVKMSGPKVGAFGPNLLGNLTPVTVDLWMARAILGRDTVTPLQSKLVDYMTSQAAKKAGLEPAEMQAAVWTGIKKLQKSRDTSAPPEVIVKEYLDKNPEIRKLFEDSLEMSKEHFQGLQSKQAPAKPPRN